MEKQYTYPNCESCGAHDKLEEDMKDLGKSNKIEHEKLFHKLNELKDSGNTNALEHQDIIHKMMLLRSDLKWNNKIGYFMVIGMMAILGTLYKIHLDNRDDAVHHIKSDTSIIALEKTSNGIAKDVEEIKKDRYLRLNLKEKK